MTAPDTTYVRMWPDSRPDDEEQSTGAPRTVVGLATMKDAVEWETVEPERLRAMPDLDTIEESIDWGE